MALSLTRHDDEGVIVLSPVGDLDLTTAETFVEEVSAAISAAVSTEPGGVVVDLSGVAFVDSAGINALLRSHRTVQRSGRAFRLENATGLVREVLEMTGVWAHLTAGP